MTTQRQVRAQFWREWQDLTLRPVPRGWKSMRQNAFPADIRAYFCDWIDQAARQGQISERLAQRITL